MNAHPDNNAAQMEAWRELWRKLLLPDADDTDRLQDEMSLEASLQGDTIKSVGPTSGVCNDR